MQMGSKKNSKPVGDFRFSRRWRTPNLSEISGSHGGEEL
jgi:hypothetical protein